MPHDWRRDGEGRVRDFMAETTGRLIVLNRPLAPKVLVGVTRYPEEGSRRLGRQPWVAAVR